MQGESTTQDQLNATAISRNSVGRPRAISEDDVRKLVELFKRGHTVATACRLSGIPRSTYYDELARNEELSDRVQASQEVFTVRAMKIIGISLNGANLKTAKWWVDRQDRLKLNAQRIAEYRAGQRLVITEMQQNIHSVRMEVEQTQ